MEGRQIMDGIITMHETIHSYSNLRKAGMIIKLDMQKVYDRVS